MTSNGLDLTFNGSDSSKTFDLSSVRNRKLFEHITYNFPPDLYFFCWRGYLDVKEQDTDINIDLYFEEYKRKHVVFQALFNLSRIKLGNRTIDLFYPPTSGKKTRTHKILYQKFPMTPQGKKIWIMAEEDGLWKKLLHTPKSFLLTTGAFTEYFYRHYFFDKEARITEYQTQLKTFKRRVGVTLPNDGKIIFDDSNTSHFVSFNYVDLNNNSGRLLKGEVSFLRASLYCGVCHQLKRLYFSEDELKVHNQRDNEYHYLCYHENKPSIMFFIKPDFIRLRHIRKRSGKVVDLASPLENLTTYQSKIHWEAAIISIGRVFRAEVLRFAYKENNWFSQKQLINHLLSNRKLTQDFNSLSRRHKNYNFKLYDETVSKVVDWLYRKRLVIFSFEIQKEAQRRSNHKSIQISESGRRFWGFLLRKYGTKKLLAAQFDLDSAYRRFVVPWILGNVGICICLAAFFFIFFTNLK